MRVKISAALDLWSSFVASLKDLPSDLQQSLGYLPRPNKYEAATTKIFLEYLKKMDDNEKLQTEYQIIKDEIKSIKSRIAATTDPAEIERLTIILRALKGAGGQDEEK